jgi:hypothetical protein
MSTTLAPDGAAAAPRRGSAWLTRWPPEDPAFWEAEGKARAWKTLAITTASLTMAFTVWFVVSMSRCSPGRRGSRASRWPGPAPTGPSCNRTSRHA